MRDIENKNFPSTYAGLRYFSAYKTTGQAKSVVRKLGLKANQYAIRKSIIKVGYFTKLFGGKDKVFFVLYKK